MKKILNFLFAIMFLIVLAYLFSPGKEYTNKLWVLKGIALAQPYKAAVAEYIQRIRSFPGPGDIEKEKIRVIVDFKNSAVKKITIGEDGPGTITVYYSTAGIESAPAGINNQTVILKPHLNNDKLTWTCNGTMSEDFLPQICK